MGPLLLCAAMDSAKLLRVGMLAMGMGIEVKEIKEAEWGQKLGALCGLEPKEAAPPKAWIGEEMAVMAFFPPELMDRLFLSMRRSGVPMPRLRAVLTGVNRTWRLGRLYEELCLETAALAARKDGGK